VLKTRVRIHTPEYIGVREPMYSTAVGLIRYAHMQDTYFGHEQESPTVSTMETHGQPTNVKKKTTEQSKEKKPGLLNKAKNIFDNFFE
jgi:cell division protein FtsA